MFPVAPIEKQCDVLEIVMSGKDVLTERESIEKYNAETQNYIKEYAIGERQNKDAIRFIELQNEDVSLTDIIR